MPAIQDDLQNEKRTDKGQIYQNNQRRGRFMKTNREGADSRKQTKKGQIYQTDKGQIHQNKQIGGRSKKQVRVRFIKTDR